MARDPVQATVARGTGRRRPSVAMAWVATALLGAVPAIVTHLVFGRVPSWMVLAQLSVGALVLVGVVTVPPLRRLWRFVAVLLTLLTATTLTSWGDFSLEPVQRLLGGTALDAQLQPVLTAKLAVAAVMVVALIGMGLRPREFFMTVGDLAARIRPVPALGFPKPDSWTRFGLIWGFGIAAVLGVGQYLLLRPPASAFVVILPMVPAILVYAAVNSVAEELAYRAPLLATARRAVSSAQALWMSAVFFGLAHYFGIPGGLFGALASIFMGWILSKAMLETRGLFWPWLIHFLSDVVIFAFLAVAFVSG
ncbi:CPBP family intramembrane glutamic endopeptidase [Microbacterium sp. SLBN-146]|uniref:CPBP family intramembrane glutamic endopeptidase n=1 Tax=Microbacterium sp. SLBN-146 TaxID=2768457 RepID=UPI0011666A14|nr:CPBP family intramembrane glutamic endopeptidase [Microbacterium sp. SLBN-146]TQJ31050.1 CAAX prenyl protease-like protein [Microbacterium sp. SLBN-146]